MPKQVSYRDIANAAGVSTATVSLSLRNHPRIPAATRNRVRACAERLGYRPHPLVGSLMQQLRSGRQGSERLVLLSDRDARHSKRLLHQHRWWRGAESQARDLGFALVPQVLSHDPEQDAALPAQWLRQGIRGVVIAPLGQPTDLSHLDFTGLAAVSCSHVLKAPALQRVAADVAWSAVIACDALWQAGRRRFGLIRQSGVDRLNDYAYPSGLRRWALMRQQVLPVPDLVLDRFDTAEAQAQMQAWCYQHRPDVILDSLSSCPWREPVARLRPRPAYANLFLLPGSPQVDGVRFDQHSLCGQAVAQVVDLLHRGAFGVPAVPLISTIRGTWHWGR